MKLKFLSILYIVGLVAFSSCEKEEMKTDTELIAAIQNASKQEVNDGDLPSAATAALSTEFSEHYTERILLANGLGYELRMTDRDRIDNGCSGSGDDRDRIDDGCSGSGDDRDRIDDGSGSGDDGDRTDDGFYVYFDLDGRQLGDRPNDGSCGGNDGVDEADVDCPELRLNIGDVCGEREGIPVYVDESCECARID
tara:strand:- start:105 stop:692 length:588 start_codon:yes stop_codon:yes gene_type:complete